jgi:CubicO group peptidase (beta-lactamase class C family)
VSRYWPEFEQHGEEAVTCRMVLGHRAGVSVLDRVLGFEEIAAWTPVIRAIADVEAVRTEPGDGGAHVSPRSHSPCSSACTCDSAVTMGA